MKQLDLDLALDELPANRWFGWIVGTLVAVGVLALALVAVAEGALREARLRPVVVTVAVPAEGEKETAVRELLAHWPEVVAVETVPEAELGALLGGTAGDDLALPRLLDVVFRPASRPDLEALRAALGEVAPGVVVSRPGPEGGMRAPAWAEVVRAVGLLLLVLVTIGAVSFAVIGVRTNVRLQTETIDVLRLMGADDRYIARQFEHFVLARGLAAALAGFAGAVVLFLTGATIGRRLWPEIFGRLEFGPLDWVALAAVPVGTVLALATVARLTARRALRRLPGA